MKILFLSSAEPTFTHRYTGAEHIVSFNLLKSFSELGHSVDFALIKYDFNSPVPNMHQDDLKNLENLGVNYLGDFSKYIKIFPSILIYVSIFFPWIYARYKTIDRINKLDELIENDNYDLIVLFWDTFFENYKILERKGDKIFGYFARPRFESAISRVKDRRQNTIVDFLKNKVLLRFYNYQIQDHFKRMSHIKAASNLCLLDVEYYKNNNVNCTYISNTWTDSFGKDSLEYRQNNYNRNDINILLSYGNMGATGNKFGIEYFLKDVYPEMVKIGLFESEKININIVGGGKLHPDIETEVANNPYINVKGFIDNIDEEMINSDIVLLLNNAGAYTGAYTRPIYTFSSSGILVAHSNIIQSMPEIRHNINALLGSSGKEIAFCIKNILEDENLRNKIMKKARLTYENEFSPISIAQNMIKNFKGE